MYKKQSEINGLINYGKEIAQYIAKEILKEGSLLLFYKDMSGSGK